MVVGATIVIGLLDNIQASVQAMAKRAATDQWFKNYFLNERNATDSGKNKNTNIFRSESGRILKLVTKMPKQ